MMERKFEEMKLEEMKLEEMKKEAKDQSMEKAKRILKKVFGYDEFRSLQEPIIRNVLAKKDSLVIMPTGAGKSLCYQVPALMFDGLTIVISPLISLMKDQVQQLRDLALPAVLLNSSLSYPQYMSNVEKIRRNEAKLLYVAPETLLKPRTLDLLTAVPVDCITIDEAHCISEWGHDFRPEYRQLTEVRKRFSNAVCLALTATATPRVRFDIKNNLQFDKSNEFVASFDRPNLFLRVIPKQNPTTQILKLLTKFKDQPGIIYCATRKQVDDLANFLVSRGISARPYHAGLTDETRHQNQEMFIKDDVQLIVATVAFGMGINKSNIRFVAHYDLPKNIESYYQEIGRAGRDGVKAYCLLLFSYGDTQKIKYFIGQKESEDERRIASLHLKFMLQYAESDECRRKPMLDYFGEEYAKENCGMCDNCLREDKDFSDITTEAQKFLACVKKTGELFGAGHIIDVLRGSKSQKVFKFQHQLVSTYGIGNEMSQKQWFLLSRQFIQKGLLTQDPNYGSLKLTMKGYDVLRGHQTVQGILAEEEIAEPGTPKRKPSAAPGIPSEYDPDLFEILRVRRKELAVKYSLPPYMIFSDRSLMDMAARLPRDNGSFLDIHGVGRAKMNKYGKDFIGLIDRYCREQQVNEAPSPSSNQPTPQSSPQSSPRTSRRSTVNPQEIGNAFNAGESIQDLIHRHRVTLDDIIKALLNYIKAGHSIRSDGILPLSAISADHQAHVMEVFHEQGTDSLKPVYQSLRGRVPYPELRILQLYFLSCNF
jgi:ATP-dependent DNA helicase RecQ